MNTPTVTPIPGLDLRSLQIDQAAMVLRGWADSTLRSLLEVETRPAEESRQLPEESRRLRDLKLRPFRGSWRQVLGLETWALKPLQFRDENLRLNHPISFLILRYLRSSSSRWLAWIPRRWRPAGILEPYWPPSLWTAIASIAWKEPRFQKEIATLVHGYFRRSQPMPGGEPPLPILRQEAWWLLVDLVGIPDMERPPTRGLYRFMQKLLGPRWAEALWRGWSLSPFHRFRRRGKLPRRLSEIAQTQALASPGWAGFWEQWLVGESLLHRPEAIARASAKTRQVLDLLPLLGQRRYRAARNKVGLADSEATIQSASPIIDPEWQSQKPNWFQADRIWNPPSSGAE